MAGAGDTEPTFYETLGVPEGASVSEIRAAYRQRVKETHPDVSDAPDARSRFKRVTRAHDVLSDERERRRYDRLGHEAYVSAEARPGPPPADASGPTGDPTGTASGAAGPTGADAAAGGRTAGGARWHDAGRPGGTAATGAGSDPPGSGEDGPFWTVTLVLARWLRVVGGLLAAWQSELTSAGAAVALAVFVAYPVFLGAAVTPYFPTAVNVFVGVCTLLVVGYLVARPTVGVAVFGAWTLVLPAVLTVSGIGVFSLGGLYSLLLTAVPLGLCLATILGSSR